MNTSTEAYKTIRENGLLSHRRFQVYEILSLNGSMTAGEVWRRFEDTNLQIDSIRPRFAELERMGVIVKCGERPCKMTGLMCAVWQTTDQLPKDLQKKIPVKTQIKLLRTCLQKAISPLKNAGEEKLVSEFDRALQMTED